MGDDAARIANTALVAVALGLLLLAGRSQRAGKLGADLKLRVLALVALALGIGIQVGSGSLW